MPVLCMHGFPNETESTFGAHSDVHFRDECDKGLKASKPVYSFKWSFWRKLGTHVSGLGFPRPMGGEPLGRDF